MLLGLMRRNSQRSEWYNFFALLLAERTNMIQSGPEGVKPMNAHLTTEQYETILDAVPEALLTIDREFVITGFNRAAETMTGYRRAEVVGRYCHDVCRSSGCRTLTDCPMTRVRREGGTAAYSAPRHDLHTSERAGVDQGSVYAAV